jgi:phosphoribosylanthranilate isomerase
MQFCYLCFLCYLCVKPFFDDLEMERARSPRIKVCCISSPDEAWTAIRAGASALGLVSAMPSGPGVIGDERIAEIAARVPPGVATFLLTCAADADTIVRQQRAARVNTLQLVDAVPLEVYPVLRAELPGVALVQVIHVRGPESVDEAEAVAAHVDAVLLDSGNPAATVKELGGTGRVHDWELSRRIRETLDVPVWLAGGLRPENVADAVARVGPFGLDVCSGVRRNGRLDAARLAALVAAATERTAEY